jgi:transposase
MRTITDVLRLHHSCGLSHKKIASILPVSHGAVGEYLKRAAAAGLSWPLPDGCDDATLNKLLFPPVRARKGNEKPKPDCILIHDELKSKGVTLLQLWTEYREEHPLGYGFSQFCGIYKKFSKSLAISMRQEHKAGEKAFSDFAGTTLPIVNEHTGVVHLAHLFVCTLGASSYTFAKLYQDETTASWCNGHADAFSFFGGCPLIIVPDNPKPVVTKPSPYEADINPSFAQMAAHFDVAVIPARIRRPKDKAKVEAAVGLATRWILAVLRKRTFFTLAEANTAVAVLLERLNQKIFQKRPGSRKSLFEEIDKPALRPLPTNTFEFCTFKKASVNADYHFAFEQHCYSVPFKYRFNKVELRITHTTIEVLFEDKRIASHVREYSPGKFTTIDEHRPKYHKEYGNWSPESVIQRGKAIGTATSDLFTAILNSRPIPEQGYRSCQGILRLVTLYSKERLDAACARALAIRGYSYKTVSSILKSGLDSRPLPEQPVQLSLVHAHVRGSAAFTTEILENNNANSSDNRQSQELETICHGQFLGESDRVEKLTGA